MECHCHEGLTGICHSGTWDDQWKMCEGIKLDGGRCGGRTQQGSIYCQGHIKLMKGKEKMNNGDCFWIVWGPDGRTNPKVSYNKESIARNEAERLAKYQPGSSFFVMRAESVSCVEKDITRKLTEPLPF